MSRTAGSKQSHAVLHKFYERWLVRIGERCQGHDQRQAAYYVWARYSMSIRTLDAIHDPHLIPDVSLICRACLEFDVALEAVIKDESTARDYLEFDKHATARYLRILSKQGDIDRLLRRREQFDEAFGEDPDDYRRTSWCAKQQGITGLMRTLGRTNEIRLYNMLSHFAHGSIWAMQTLDRKITDPERISTTMVESAYISYLGSSRAFISFIWEPITTPEGESCKSDFTDILSAHAAESA